MTKALENLLDSYNLRARLFPATLVLLPLGLGAAAWVPIDVQGLGTLGALAASVGLATLLQQFARDEGKRKEDGLYRLWAGKPSVRMLSYAHSGLNRRTLTRCHAQLRALAPDLAIPASLEDEAKNPTDASVVYEACSDFLVAKTRDKDKFSLLFEENMNYGFRRNLWGLKPYGIATVLVGLAAIGFRVASVWQSQAQVEAIQVGCAAASFVLLLVWCFVVKPGWVRRAAEAYAGRLVLCCDQLEPPKGTVRSADPA